MFRGTDNVQRQISEPVFAPNGGYCVYYPSNFFGNARCFGNIKQLFTEVEVNIHYFHRHLGTVHFLQGRGGWWDFLKCH